MRIARLPGDPISILVIGIAAIGMVVAGRVLSAELAISQAEDRLISQQRAVDAGDRPSAPVLPPYSAATPPRERLPDALLLARQAASLPSGTIRDGLIARAAAEAAAAAAARPRWGEAWAITAYIASLRRDGQQAMRDALIRSYDDARYLRHTGAWRVRTGFALWDELDPATRGRVIAEAVWLARIDLSLRAPIFSLARTSTGYRPFLAQWHDRRVGDPDY